VSAITAAMESTQQGLMLWWSRDVGMLTVTNIDNHNTRYLQQVPLNTCMQCSRFILNLLCPWYLSPSRSSFDESVFRNPSQYTTMAVLLNQLSPYYVNDYLDIRAHICSNEPIGVVI
jgi:hypothetical protein